ncbi:MAG: hypothetical protein B7Z45_02035 [Azorhizobium sp. 12-66-6]|nr:MAG: hypothetical protein B7Z45_02035 [Azorhizobium sp. 12-66-6]
METRANYTTIGAFTLIVIVAAFAFVYWFARPQDSEGRKTYEIVYSGTVSGLRQGNNVLFNGIPVGQVLQLGLVPGAPDEVLVRVGVQPNVPILADARATLESQGLTGIVAVSIRGGEANAAPLPIGPNGFPRIEAEGGSGMASLIETVQGVARRVNAVLEEDVGSLLKRVNDLSGQLNDLANKADSVLDNLKRATGDKDGMVQQVSDAAASVRRLSDNLDKRTADLAGQIEKFTGPGLRQYEALATDGRRTLSEIERVFKNLERNPRQFIFGGSSVPEYRR